MCTSFFIISAKHSGNRKIPVPVILTPRHGIPSQLHVFQLHGDTFAIPYGGRLLCTGSQVKNQAFTIRNCLGLQFHVEMTEAIIRDWCRELKHADREKIARDTPRYLERSNALCRMVGEEFVRLCIELWCTNFAIFVQYNQTSAQNW